MTLPLEELRDHIDQVRRALNQKRVQLPVLLFRDPSLAMQVRYQIECLEPRLDELERHALRLTKEREALAASLPAAV